MVFGFFKDVCDGVYRTVAGTANGVVHGAKRLVNGFTGGFADVALYKKLIHRKDVSAIRRMELQVHDTVDCVSTTLRDVRVLTVTVKLVAERLNSLGIFIWDTAQSAAKALDHIQDVQERQHKETKARLIIMESNNIVSEVGDLQNNIANLIREVERKKKYIQDYRKNDQMLSFLLIVEILAILFVSYLLVFCGGHVSQQEEVNAMPDEVSALLESLQTKIKNLGDGNSHMEQACMWEKMLSLESSYVPLVVAMIIAFMLLILLAVLKKSRPQMS